MMSRRRETLSPLWIVKRISIEKMKAQTEMRIVRWLVMTLRTRKTTLQTNRQQLAEDEPT